MRKLTLFFTIFAPLFINAQINESFSDGDFLEQPEWTGTTANFVVNPQFQLQSNAVATSTSFLFTPSAAIDEAVWECSFKINYTTSASNYAAIYIVSDVNDLTEGCNGYYVQVGGTNDEVSLFLQQGSKKTKIIDGVDKRTDGNPIEIRIKVERDKAGNFSLYSKLPAEPSYQLEGITKNSTVNTTRFVGLMYSNTSTTGKSYIFDDILVSGKPAPDTQKPVLVSATIKQPDKILLQFSEIIDFSKMSVSIKNTSYSYTDIVSLQSGKIIEIQYNTNFELGRMYEIQLDGIVDLVGNKMDMLNKKIGIPQAADVGDLIWNEVLFDAPADGQEYVELMNRSDKVIDLAKVVFATRKTDGTLNTAVSIPFGNFVGPQEIVALALNPDSVLRYFNLIFDNQIVATNNWYSLNNESAKLVLCNIAKDTIYDEVYYNKNWHHVLISDTKGVALERINPNRGTQDATNWHSAASEVNYGTPGYKNSQFRLLDETIPEKAVWCDPEVFSPDNDGNADICYVRYNTEYAGFVANVAVFNAGGIKIADLAQNQLLSTEGYISWDGKTARGTNAETGIYLLYFEMFQPATGQKKIFKLPLVVSAR